MADLTSAASRAPDAPAAVGAGGDAGVLHAVIDPTTPGVVAGRVSGRSDIEDALLIARVAAKEKGAFERLYRAYYSRLTRFLERMTRSPELIDEILDDTMLVVWSRAATFNGTSRASTWIFAIAYNHALKALRRTREPVDAAPDEDASDPAVGPEPEMMARQARDRMKSMLDRLSPEQRAVVDLTYYHGYSYKEIAEIACCPVDTVKTRMFHARRHLRRMLSAVGREGMA